MGWPGLGLPRCAGCARRVRQRHAHESVAADFLLFEGIARGVDHDHGMFNLTCSSMPPSSIRRLRLGAALSIAILPTGLAWAEMSLQRQELAGAYRQIEAIERRIERSSAAVVITPGDRYYFDYARFQADLARVRAGIAHYLTPSRAQPRDVEALSGQYRTQAPSAEPPATQVLP